MRLFSCVGASPRACSVPLLLQSSLPFVPFRSASLLRYFGARALYVESSHLPPSAQTHALALTPYSLYHSLLPMSLPPLTHSAALVACNRVAAFSARLPSLFLCWSYSLSLWVPVCTFAQRHSSCPFAGCFVPHCFLFHVVLCGLPSCFFDFAYCIFFTSLSSFVPHFLSSAPTPLRPRQAPYVLHSDWPPPRVLFHVAHPAVLPSPACFCHAPLTSFSLAPMLLFCVVVWVDARRTVNFRVCVAPLPR